MLKKITEVRDLCISIFNSVGVSNALSQLVIDDLINNDIQGYCSHGIMRVKEYINYIKQGDIIPSNQPKKSEFSNITSMIDGNKSFGVLVQRKIVSHLLQKLDANKFGFVTFSNAGHIGRLASIATPIVNTGGVIIGFSNFSGSGQIVVPFGGTLPKLSTNPIVMGAPSSEGPILIDFSTSAYSEGKLRDAYYKNKKIPNGVLVDKMGNSIKDPKEFYEKYGEVFLMPLGGKELGYKGFGLSLFTEILAGILSDGGASSIEPRNKANSGLFIAFMPEIFNISSSKFNAKVNDLINYIREQSAEQHFGNVKIPGLKKINNNKITTIDLPEKIFSELMELKNA